MVDNMIAVGRAAHEGPRHVARADPGRQGPARRRVASTRCSVPARCGAPSSARSRTCSPRRCSTARSAPARSCWSTSRARARRRRSRSRARRPRNCPTLRRSRRRRAVDRGSRHRPRVRTGRGQRLRPTAHRPRRHADPVPSGGCPPRAIGPGRVVREFRTAGRQRRRRPRSGPAAVGEQAVPGTRSRWTWRPTRPRPAARGHAARRRRGARPAAGRGTAGRCRPRSARAAAARRTPGSRPPATRTGRRPGTRRSAGPAAVHTSAPSSITATAHVAAVGSSSGSSAAARSRSARVTDGGRELHPATDPGQHPADVGVEHGVPPAEGERRDRRGGVVADAGQRAAGRRTPRAPRRRAAPRSRSPRRAAAAPGAGSRAGPRRAPPRRWRGGEVRGRRPALEPGSCTGSTRATGVCWSMNSETITDHGAGARRRQGRSRAWSSYHSRTGLWRSLIVLRMLVGPAIRTGTVSLPDPAGSAGYREPHERRHPSARPVAGSRVLDPAAARARAGVPAGLRDRPGARRRQRRFLLRRRHRPAGRRRAQHHAREQRRGAEQRRPPRRPTAGAEGQADQRRRWPSPTGPATRDDVTVEPLIRRRSAGSADPDRAQAAHRRRRRAPSRSPTTPSR